MNIDTLFILIGLAVEHLFLFTIIYTQHRTIIDSSKVLTNVLKEANKVSLARLALEASVQTNSMMGPAVLQQLKDSNSLGPRKEEQQEKKTGVTIKYDGMRR